VDQRPEITSPLVGEVAATKERPVEGLAAEDLRTSRISCLITLLCCPSTRPSRADLLHQGGGDHCSPMIIPFRG
jgi:hypothetical protein